jgi:CRISPR-associated protein Csb1
MAEQLNQLFDQLGQASRLLIEAELRPMQADRFQPTGFPDLGAALYKAPRTREDGKVEYVPMLLVESAQSMANRMEKVCWDEETNQIVAPLASPPLPHVIVDLGNGLQTNSLEEAHRLNSIYIIEHKPLEQIIAKAVKGAKGRPIDRAALAETIFKLDPNSLIHGVFFARSTLAGGRARFQRLLSGFIEAYKVEEAHSGGVKNEMIDPSGNDAYMRYAHLPGSKEEKLATKKALDSALNVPYPRRDFVAEKIVAYFNLDLATLRGYRLGDNANRLLMALSLYKVLKVLKEGLKLRTACDFDVVSVKATRPATVDLSDTEKLLADVTAALPKLIEECNFGDNPVTQIAAPPPTGKPRPKGKDETESASSPATEDADNDETTERSEEL